MFPFVLAYLENQLNERPILLLDDILSELDETSKSYVLELLEKQQTIITSADIETKQVLEKFKIQLISLLR